MSGVQVVPPAASTDRPVRRPALRIDRVALGIIVVAAGVGWYLETTGVSVPWSAAVPVTLTVVGILLLVVVLGQQDRGVRAGRSGLAWLGAALTVISVALGVGLHEYAAPVGNVSLSPAAVDFPVQVDRSAGNVELDLSEHALPAEGVANVRLGAGNVELILPADLPVQVDIRVTAGQVVVDGRQEHSGLDLRWSNTAPAAGVTVIVQVATGEVRVRHG